MICMMNRIEGTEEVSDEAKFEAVLQAVKRGEKEAKTQLAWFKLSGRGGCEVDEEGAFDLLEERVKADDAEALWMLGLCYEYGMGTRQDWKQAGELYAQSSARGSVIGGFLSRRSSIGSGKIEGICLFFFFYHKEVEISFLHGNE